MKRDLLTAVVLGLVLTTTACEPVTAIVGASLALGLYQEATKPDTNRCVDWLNGQCSAWRWQRELPGFVVPVSP